MKKGIALLLTLFLAGGASVPAYAEDTAQAADQKQTVAVSLGSIEGIMTTYNLDLQTYANTLRIASYNDKNPDDSMKDYYDNQYDLAKVQYEDNVADAVLNAKQSYLTFCTDNDRYAAALASAQNAQSAYSAALASLSGGFLSQKDCDALKDQLYQTQNTLAQLDSQLTRETASLRTLLNLPDNVNMSVKPVSADDVDVSGISSINYGADLIVMRGNDSAIKKAKLNYDYIDDTANTNYELQNANYALQQVRTSEEAAFKKLYDSLTAAFAVYRQDLDQVQRAQQALDAEEKALAAGYSSQKSANDKTSQLKTLQSTLSSDRNTLLTAYLSYINMKNGFSTGS